MKWTILIFLELFLILATSQAQDIGVAYHLANQLIMYPQEKVYVHSDKDFYRAVDTLWFRAYVADASLHVPLSASKYVYVELQSREKPASGEQPAEPLRLRIREQDGVYTGYMPFAMTAPGGDYTLCAYTRFMDNAGPEYFYRKNIRIGAYGRPFELPTPSHRQLAWNVSFFPEGGYLVSGKRCCVGFKVLRADGQSTSVSGVVRDDAEHEVAVFRSGHGGMGKFYFTPVAGRSYTAICTDDANNVRSVELPAVRTDACILQVFPSSDWFTVDIAAADDYDTAGLSLLIHCRGKVCYYDGVDSHKTFARKDFPNGVLQLLLLDKQGNALSERLLFCYNEKTQPSVAVMPDKPVYGRREKVTLAIEVHDVDGVPITGSFSVSVTDNRVVDPHRPSDIRTAFLLESELRGYVENPAYYFDAENPAQMAESDAMMLTQGWRRYDIPAVLQGRYAVPSEPLEIGQEITGRIRKTGLLRKRNFKDYQISMLAPSRGVMASAAVDSAGRFALNGFDLPDCMSCVLRAWGSDNREDVELLIDEERFPDTGYPIPRPHSTALVDRYNRNFGLFSDSLKNILLEEVVISGAVRKVPRIHHEVLAVGGLDYQEIEKEKYNNLEEALQRQHGVSIQNGYAYVFQRPAAYIIDGVLWEPWQYQGQQQPAVLHHGGTDQSVPQARSFQISQADPLFGLMEGLKDKMPNHIPIDFIKRIDIIPPVNTALYGVRIAGRGVIYITTKTGAEPLSGKREDLDHLNIKMVSPLGYQKPAEFYSPAYDTPKRWNAPERDTRTTLYWNPVLCVADGKAEIIFYTADETADFNVNIEGIGYNPETQSYKTIKL